MVFNIFCPIILVIGNALAVGNLEVHFAEAEIVKSTKGQRPQSESAVIIESVHLMYLLKK